MDADAESAQEEEAAALILAVPSGLCRVPPPLTSDDEARMTEKKHGSSSQLHSTHVSPPGKLGRLSLL